jgi:hypothetical protein
MTHFLHTESSPAAGIHKTDGTHAAVFCHLAEAEYSF